MRRIKAGRNLKAIAAETILDHFLASCLDIMTSWHHDIMTSFTTTSWHQGIMTTRHHICREGLWKCEQCLCNILVAQVKYMLNFMLFLLKTVYSGNFAIFYKPSVAWAVLTKTFVTHYFSQCSDWFFVKVSSKHCPSQTVKARDFFFFFWSCNPRANERPKKTAPDGTDRQTDRQ